MTAVDVTAWHAFAAESVCSIRPCAAGRHSRVFAPTFQLFFRTEARRVQREDVRARTRTVSAERHCFPRPGRNGPRRHDVAAAVGYSPSRSRDCNDSSAPRRQAESLRAREPCRGHPIRRQVATDEEMASRTRIAAEVRKTDKPKAPRSGKTNPIVMALGAGSHPLRRKAFQGTGDRAMIDPGEITCLTRAALPP